MLKLYKKTFIACISMALFTFVVAIACKVIGVYWAPETFDFLSNFMIGICCSSLVVILTTYLQIKAEFSRLNSQFSSRIRFLAFRFSLCEIEPDEGETPSERYYAYITDELDKSFDEISESCSQLCFFKKEKDDLLTNIHRSVIKCKINAVMGDFPTQKERLASFILENKNEIISILNNALLLGLSFSDKESAEKYIKECGDVAHDGSSSSPDMG